MIGSSMSDSLCLHPTYPQFPNRPWRLQPEAIGKPGSSAYCRPLYWSREPKELEAGARMPNGRTVDSTAKRQLISNRT